MEEKEKCPICNHMLYERHEGVVCKNHKCKLYHKLNKGWIKIGKSKKQERLKWDLSWLKEITFGERLHKWLELKNVLKRDNYTCQRCQYTLINYQPNDVRLLIMHHINRRAEYPELIFDPDNCITLCEICDDEIHEKDKYFFRKKS